MCFATRIFPACIQMPSLIGMNWTELTWTNVNSLKLLWIQEKVKHQADKKKPTCTDSFLSQLLLRSPHLRTDSCDTSDELFADEHGAISREKLRSWKETKVVWRKPFISDRLLSFSCLRSLAPHQRTALIKRFICSVQFRSVQYCVYALGKVHMRSAPSLRSFPNVETLKQFQC